MEAAWRSPASEAGCRPFTHPHGSRGEGLRSWGEWASVQAPGLDTLLVEMRLPSPPVPLPGPVHTSLFSPAFSLPSPLYSLRAAGPSVWSWFPEWTVALLGEVLVLSPWSPKSHVQLLLFWPELSLRPPAMSGVLRTEPLLPCWVMLPRQSGSEGNAGRVYLPVCLSSVSFSLSLSQSLTPSLPGKAALWEAGAWGTPHSPDLCHCLDINLSNAPEHPDLDYKLCSHGPIRAEESHSLSTCF